MTQFTLAPSRRGAHPILVAGLVVGTLDILAAFAVRYAFARASPVRVLQGIASGLLGPAAFNGGAATAALGMLLHFVIAFTVGAIFFGVSRSWRFLLRHAVVSGIVYGVAVYWMMNSIVLPLSRLPMGAAAPPVRYTLVMIAIHIVCVGLPIAVIVARSDRVRERG